MSLRVRNVRVKSFVGGVLTDDDEAARTAVAALMGDGEDETYETWRANSGERSLLNTHMSTESGRLILTVVYTD
ncbi:MAG: hypothetical protein OXH68_15175 [Gammaproteobacteria bacterium]|nr:hypothetical protein [Gammaproteobacteria bacterium]